MSECPKCGAGVSDDFGVVNCPSCKTTLLIDIDGNISVNDSMNVEEVSQANIVAQEYQELEAPQDIEGPPDFALPEESAEAQGFENSQLIEDPQSHMELTTFEEATQFKATAPPPFEEVMERQAEEEEVEPLAEEPEAPAANDLSDIAKFANANTSTLDKGSFTYDLLISGIDSSEIRRSLYEALQDSKFLWNAEDVIAKVKAGCLKIPELTPIKAHILIERIKGLPVEISWEQHEIHT